MNLFHLGLLLVVGYAVAKPATYNDYYLSIGDDADSVGSNLRTVLAPVPAGFATEVEDLLTAGTEARNARQAKGASEPKKTKMKNASGKSDEGGYYKTYGSDAEGEKGYLKEAYNKGDHGYKTLDTFHKQDGDSYGYEKHTAFGKAKGGEEGGKHGKSGSYSNQQDAGKDEDHEGAGTIVDTHYVPVSAGAGGDYHESEHYTEGDTSGGDVGYYSEGGDAGDAAHYTGGVGGDGDSGSYSTGDSYSEHYSSGSDDGDGNSHSSYTSGDDFGDHQGYSDAGYEGDHY